MGAAYSGSPSRLPDGVRIAGIDVGGMTPEAAETLLERRATALRRVPVTFFSGDSRWRLTPQRLGVEADWAAAVDAARRQGGGFGHFRGLRRVKVRVFGADIAPPAKVYEPALQYELQQLAAAIDRPHREAAIVLKNLKPILVPGQEGRRLQRERAAATLVGALASLSRAPTPLPVRMVLPSVTPADLQPALAATRVAVSAPVRLRLGKTWWRLRPRGVARLLLLPHDGSRRVTIGGPGADAWFARFASRIGRAPRDAGFRLASGGRVEVTPHESGIRLDVARTRDAIARAALSPRRRTARVVVAKQPPKLTSAEARAMGITRVLGGYTTPYSGTADRIRNLQLAIQLIDGTLVAPGSTFSLNAEVGERTLERGFRPAPVIIGGEYEEGVGGGVSQVATTVFNAAWEAGLKIVERHPHSLYISRYPRGRDATVNYPDLDLKFRNDTPRWLRVFAWTGGGSITVAIAGPETGRRVVSEAGDLLETGPVPVKRVRDPSLPVGTSVIEAEGAPPRTVAVKRVVYRADGSVLYDETWRTSYRGEKKIVRVGTKKPEPEEPEEPPTKGEPKQPPRPAPPPPTPTTTIP